MPEVLIHLIVPAAALIVAGFDRKSVLMLCFFAVIPDIDIVFGAHRAFLHSITVLGAIAAVLLIYTHYYKPKYRTYAVIISILLLSHPFLDLFTGYVQLFWPSNLYFWIKIDAPTLDPITAGIDFSAFSITLLITTPGGLPTPSEPMPLFYNTGLILLIVMGCAILYWIIKTRKVENKKNNSIQQSLT